MLTRFSSYIQNKNIETNGRITLLQFIARVREENARERMTPFQRKREEMKDTLKEQREKCRRQQAKVETKLRRANIQVRRGIDLTTKAMVSKAHKVSEYKVRITQVSNYKTKGENSERK